MKSKNMNIPFSRPSYRRLSDEQCQKLHEAALEILDRTGVRLHYQPAVALLRVEGRVFPKGIAC
jgi:trimethylamine:corrinoid methyltransferase-like protein